MAMNLEPPVAKRSDAGGTTKNLINWAALSSYCFKMEEILLRS